MSRPLTCDEAIIVAIRRITQAVEAYSRFLWQEYGLTAPQLGCLRELQHRQRATPTELSEALHISVQTMAGILKRLEQRGLISRAAQQHDRRSVAIQISEAGRVLADASPNLMRDQFRKQLDELQTWEKTQLLATLQRVAHMMHADEPADAEEDPFLYSNPQPDPAPISTLSLPQLSPVANRNDRDESNHPTHSDSIHSQPVDQSHVRFKRQENSGGTELASHHR